MYITKSISATLGSDRLLSFVKTPQMDSLPVEDVPIPGGYSHVNKYGDVPPKCVGVLQEIPKNGSHCS